MITKNVVAIKKCIYPTVLVQIEYSGKTLTKIPSGLFWSLYKRAALWRTLYGPSATKRPLRTMREEKGVPSRFRVGLYLVAI